MGARGPKPTPTKILEQRGSWRAKTRGGEPTPTMGKPDCPLHYTDAFKAEWNRFCTILEGMGVLTIADGPSLEILIDTFMEFKEAESHCLLNGKVIEYSNGTIGPNPWQNIKSKARTDLDRMLAKFGMSPADRARLTIVDKPDDDKDGIGSFIKNK